jgi:sulfate permease, SulP family
VVGFVESVSVGQTLAATRRQRIEPDRELVALVASNLGAAFSGGFPVTGGFARSVVNFDAGSQTPAAGLFTAFGILMAALWLTPALHYVPQATLAATIIVAVLSLVDRLTGTELLQHLRGRVFLTHFQAQQQLAAQ